jgi:DNA-binding response OmpR family regulator
VAAAARSTPLVLLVEDDPSIQGLLRRVLRLSGFTSVQASTVPDAITVAQQHDIDAVILDLTLEEQEAGLNFLVWLRVQPWYGDIPVAILTGKQFVATDEQEMIRRYRAQLFYKPGPLETLIKFLKTAIVEP